MSFAELKRKCLKYESAYMHNVKRPHATLTSQESKSIYPNKYADKQQYFADREAKSQAKRQNFLQKAHKTKPKPWNVSSGQQTQGDKSKSPPQTQQPPVADKSVTCSRCHTQGHAGPWSPLCPHHIPNYVPGKVYRANAPRPQGSQQAGGQQGAPAPPQSGGGQASAQGSGQADRNRQAGGGHKGQRHGHRK